VATLASTHTQRFVRIKWVRVGIREVVSMPLSEIVASKLLPCPKCGSLVWLARIMPDELECDQPTFECEDCGHQVARIFEQSVPQPTTAAGSGGRSNEAPILTQIK